MRGHSFIPLEQSKSGESLGLASNKGVFANKIIIMTSTKNSLIFLFAHLPCHYTMESSPSWFVRGRGDSSLVFKVFFKMEFFKLLIVNHPSHHDTAALSLARYHGPSAIPSLNCWPTTTPRPAFTVKPFP